MIQYILRTFERFAILIPGIVIAYFSVRNIFPYFEDRLPLGLAVLVTYALGAYILIPALIRIFRSVHPAKHSPLYCITPDGFASDPLNIGVIANRRQVIMAMQRAGWNVADQKRIMPLVRQIIYTIVNRPYPNAPVSSLFLFGRAQDLAFEKLVEGGRLGNRHHVRFWTTGYDNSKPLSRTSIQWEHRHRPSNEENVLWVGAASLDVGLTLIRHNLQISHMIDPDTDKERVFIVNQLQHIGLVKQQTNITLRKAYRLSNRVWRGYLQTDGTMTIIELDATHLR
jgi:hypothetical protein